MRTFSETETLVIEALKNNGVKVTKDSDSSEFYALYCSKDGFKGSLYYSDVDGCFNLESEKINAVVADFVKEMTTEKVEIKYPASVSEF